MEHTPLIPVLGLWHGLDEGVKVTKTPVAYVSGWCGNWQNEHMFAVYVHGERMSPRFRPGELVFIDPVRPPQNGKDVLVEFTDQVALLRRLVSFSPSHITLRQFNPPRTIKYHKSKIRSFYRVCAIFCR
ncbi:S24 family peptidase [Thalassospira lucentensis]|uniref:S24 family peptidase n=1 Tax=Thalassospira lucentensis TaxID=168935 RepID=UPI003D2F4AF8